MGIISKIYQRQYQAKDHGCNQNGHIYLLVIDKLFHGNDPAHPLQESTFSQTRKGTVIAEQMQDVCQPGVLQQMAYGIIR